VLAVPLAILGIGLVVGAFAGRALWLTALALPLLLVTSIVAVVPSNLPSSWSAGVGERTWRPVTIAQTQNGYQLSVGDAELDLTALPVTPESLTRIKAEVGVGQLQVRVPANTTVIIRARVGAGELVLPGALPGSGSTTGSSASDVALDQTVTLSPVGAVSAGTLDLDLNVGLGNLEVRRATS